MNAPTGGRRPADRDDSDQNPTVVVRSIALPATALLAIVARTKTAARSVDQWVQVSVIPAVDSLAGWNQRRIAAAPPLPVWLRRRPAPTTRAERATPRQARWWVGVLWLGTSALLLGFVGHVTLFGALQHSQSQQIAYDNLRSTLAEAVTPVGQLDVDEKLVAPGTPIALMTIPKLGLNEVVSEGTASAETRSGVGHRRDSVMPGQAGTSVLYGRQAGYGGPFGALTSLVPGDEITIVTGQGKQTFTVFGLRRAGDALPAALGADAGRLQLVTADGPALAPYGVLYVDASLKG